MTLQARLSVLVLPALVLIPGLFTGARMAAFLGGALLSCIAASIAGRVLMARLVGARHRRTVFHGLGASHDYGRLHLREALPIHVSGVVAVGLLTAICTRGDSYLAQCIASIGVFWTVIQAAPVQPTCGGDAAWNLLRWWLGPIQGEAWSSRLTLLGAVAGCWASLQLGLVFLIPLGAVALHHGWVAYRSRSTEPAALLVLPGAPA